MEQGIQTPGTARQRIIRTEEQILCILDEYDSSGFTAKEFAEVSDINDATFYSWLKKYRTKPDQEPGGFTTIEVTPVFDKPSASLFAKVGQIEVYKEVSAGFLKSLLV